MSNPAHLDVLNAGVTIWNTWRLETFRGKPDLADAYLSGRNLGGADFSNTDLNGAYLIGANLGDADLTGSELSESSLIRADLRRANLDRASLSFANLSETSDGHTYEELI